MWVIRPLLLNPSPRVPSIQSLLKSNSEPNDQLESKCIDFKDLSIARKLSDFIMQVGHCTPTFEPLAPSAIKPDPFEEQPPIIERKSLSSILKYAFLGECL